MVTFEKEKLRDKSYRKQFDTKLKEIQEIQSKHNYLEYVANRELFDELVIIYEKNINDYNACYKKNLDSFLDLKNALKASNDKIHKVRIDSLEKDLKDIETSLAVEDYNINKQTESKLKNLKSQLGEYEGEFYQLTVLLNSFKDTIEKNKSNIWLEEIDKLQSQYDVVKSELYGTSIPKNIGIDNKKIELLKEDKSKAIKSLAAKLGSDKLLKEFEKPSYLKDFKEFKKAVLKAKNKRNIIILIASILVFFLLVLYFGVIAPSQKESKAWNEAQETGKYTTYINEYPNGIHIKEATDKMKVISLKEESSFWKKMTTTKNKLDVERYIVKYPNGQYISEAKKMLLEERQKYVERDNVIRVLKEIDFYNDMNKRGNCCVFELKKPYEVSIGEHKKNKFNQGWLISATIHETAHFGVSNPIIERDYNWQFLMIKENNLLKITKVKEDDKNSSWQDFPITFEY